MSNTALVAVGCLLAGGAISAVAIQTMSKRSAKPSNSSKTKMPKNVRSINDDVSLTNALTELALYKKATPENFTRWNRLAKVVDELRSMTKIATRKTNAHTLFRALGKSKDLDVTLLAYLKCIHENAEAVNLNRRSGAAESLEWAADALRAHVNECVQTVRAKSDKVLIEQYAPPRRTK